MARDPEVRHVAAAVRMSISLLLRRLRQTPPDGGLTMPEAVALARLEKNGPLTSSELAKLERISPQSMGATLAALERSGLVERHPDPDDGRRALLSLTKAGRNVRRSRTDARTTQIAEALATGFTKAELKQLMAAAPLLERLAERI
jgi:DNA-binding MarR family transcriptional regulator